MFKIILKKFVTIWNLNIWRSARSHIGTYVSQSSSNIMFDLRDRLTDEQTMANDPSLPFETDAYIIYYLEKKHKAIMRYFCM